MRLEYVGTEPQRAYPDDAGLDLRAHGVYWVQPGEMIEVNLGVSVKSPSGHWVMLTGRSSMAKRRLHVPVGIIDPGYTGPLFGVVLNLGPEAVRIEDQERICQMVIMQNSTEKVELTRVDQLPETERGDRGFGSTGR